ncbi:MAG: sodium:solute symporter family protein [archaeon]
MNLTLVILLIYLALMFLIAWLFSRKQSLEAYFINKRKTSLWLLTFSNVATIVGAGGSVAIVAEVYNSGISYGLALPASLTIGVLILGIVAKKIKEVGDEYNATTIVDFFNNRFDKKNKVLTGVLQIFLLVGWIGVQAIAMGSLASVLIGIDFQIAIFFTALITILYTSLGGLKVDLITDFVQFWIILIIFIILAFIGFGEVGGISNLFSQLPAGHLDPFAFGGIGWFVGLMLFSGFLFLSNTTHWQRIFSAENQKTARNSFFFSIPLVLLLGIVILFLGLVAAVSLSEIKQETAIFSLMDYLLPPSLVGIGFAAILAIIMSSIDSLLIGGSAIIYKGLFKKTHFENKKEILAARIITAMFGILGFLIASLFSNIITLSLLFFYLALIFVPPVLAGLYSKKTTSEASFYSILIPTVLLFGLYPFVKENTFLITTPLGIIIILLYDKIFSRRKNPQVG